MIRRDAPQYRLRHEVELLPMAGNCCIVDIPQRRFVGGDG
jgi:hypothetical protein